MPDPLATDQTDPATMPAAATPLFQTILDAVHASLRQRGYPLPAIKRLALLVTGVLVAPSATRGDLAFALEGLAITPATSESIARRLARLLDDPDLDPQRLLPDLFADQVPTLLQSAVAAHQANQRTAPSHHQRFRPVQIVVDATTKEDDVHVLVAGLAYRGIVIPLAVRVWEQNVPLEAGAFWLHLHALLLEVQALLPPVLRDHVLLLADRGFGVPHLVDLLTTLDWAWILRIQGQVRIQFPDGTVRQARDLAPRPGAVWCRGVDPQDPPDLVADPAPPLAAFKAAGWRNCQLVAAWAPGAEEPWLLLTNLPARKERFAEYARRWAIERLFLTWKSHGWDLERLQMTAPDRFGRLLSGLVVATVWCVACALPRMRYEQEDLMRRAQGRGSVVTQLRLPLFGDDPPAARPWAGKFSITTWGRKVLMATPCRFQTPAQCWNFPEWDAPPWSIQAQELYHATP